MTKQKTISKEAQEVLRPEWDKMQDFLGLKPKTIGVDFDGTLCKKQKYGDGTIHNKPNDKAAEVMKKLKKDGYRLVIFTVRLNPVFGGDIEWKREQIAQWCEIYGIPYDEITNNKPEAFAYIDDRAIRFTNWQDVGNYFLQ